MQLPMQVMQVVPERYVPGTQVKQLDDELQVLQGKAQ